MQHKSYHDDDGWMLNRMYAVTKGVKFEASGSCNLPCAPLIFENPYNPTRNYDNDDDDDDLFSQIIGNKTKLWIVVPHVSVIL